LGDTAIPPIALLAGAAAVVSLIVFGTGLAGAWLDVALFRAASQALDRSHPGPADRASLREALNARLTAHIATILVLGFVVLRLVDAGYEELTSPTISPAPLVARIVGHAPEAVAALVVVWLVAEAVGGLALRRHVADGPSRRAAGAVVAGLRAVIRPGGLATLVITDLVVLGLALAMWLAASGTWIGLGDRLADGASALDLGLALLAFIVAWLAGLLLLSVALAWRAVAWTAESLRIARPRSVPAAVNEPVGEAV
jgi:hypothetical protein